MRGLCFVFTWTFLVTLCEPDYDKTVSCLHDVIQEDPKSFVPSGDSWKKMRRRTRETFHGARHLRIQPVYFLSQYLLEEEKLALQKVLQRAVSRIEGLLSVIHKVDGPLLLKRKDACPIILKNGINKGRCSRIAKGYQGEHCLDSFIIPSGHLEGFSVYNKTHPDPIKVYKTDGPGVEDTDFVLYVTSETTAMCNPYKTSALAYAAACQLDRYGRPIAGQVNFCPRTLKTQKFDEELLYKTAIHELFHALGFSRQLFDKFVTCDKDGTCNPRTQTPVQIINGTARLLTPAVMREMKDHFGCDSDNFGGPLETVAGKASSHWDSIMMHSSIMTAKEQKPYLTLIDRITLAVFEDSGWYTVDYSQSDPFIWGKGKGCQFGTAKHCDSKDGFCSSNSTGCHHLRLSKAKCNSNPKVQPDGCGIFAADQKACFLDSSKALSSSEDETFSMISRCYLSTLVPVKDSQTKQISNPVEKTGRCYETKCEADKVFVRVQAGGWVLCDFGSTVQIDNFDGFIECPPSYEICSSFYIHDLTTALPASSSPISSHNPTDTEDQDDESKMRHLYADIKISTPLNTKQIDVMKRAFIKDVTVKNEILVPAIQSTSSHNSVRVCISMKLEEDNTLDRFALKDLFYESVTKTFGGHYDDETTVDVLTSSSYFCKPACHKRYCWYSQGSNNAHSVIYTYSYIPTTIIVFLCFLSTVVLFPISVF